MQSASKCNMNQYCYCGNRSVHASLDKVSNSKDFKIEKSEPKAQEPEALNSNNSLRLKPGRNAKTSNKAQKEKKKY